MSGPPAPSPQSAPSPLPSTDHVTVSIGKDSKGRDKIQPGANLAAVIKDLEREMREAATNLEFEKAARLRDEVKQLREMELALSGEVT